MVELRAHVELHGGMQIQVQIYYVYKYKYNTQKHMVELRAHVEVHGRPTSLAFLETTQTLTSPHYRLGIIITNSSVLS